MAVLYVIATPIGNLGDITYRGVRMLARVDVLACEDTRRTRKIYEYYAIPRPRVFFSYHEYNEDRAGDRILSYLDSGNDVGLCTNAGYPGISDPGYRIISRTWDRGHVVQVIPGAGAVEVALISSGLSTASYVFKGFPPKKVGQRKRFLLLDKEQPHTLVFFESPHRLGSFLKDAYDVLGNRKAAVCIELTKKFEEVHRDSLAELVVRFKDKAVKGEVSVVVAGSNPKFLVQE